MSEDARNEDEQIEEIRIGAEEDAAECCIGPCDVWPPKLGHCGGNRAWVFIAGRWICRPV